MAQIAITEATTADAAAILALQKLAYQSEAKLYNDWSLPPLTQTIESLLKEFESNIILKAMAGDRIVGSVRGSADGETCRIGRLIVHPEMQRQGIGSQLLRSIEERFPAVLKYELFTGDRSAANLRLYQRHGYRTARTERVSAGLTLVFLERRRGA